MAEKYVLSIDQGTTGTTVLIFDRDGFVRGRAYSEFTQYFPKPGWVEHDATEIWNVSIAVIQQSLASSNFGIGDIDAIGITNQRETVVLWDRTTGTPIHRAIVWQDRRTAGFCDELRSRGLEKTFRKKTGLVIDPYFSASKVKWLLDNIPGLRKRAEDGNIAFGTIDSWLVWKLTGGKAHVTDFSNASRTQLFNINELVWDSELLELFDIPDPILPKVVPSSRICGYTDENALPGAKQIPISGIAGDQQAALFGQACHGEGLAKNTYGTGSFVLMNTGFKAIQSNEKLLTTIAWGIGDEPVEYSLEGAIFVTGAGVQWLRDELQIIESATDTEALARSLVDNGGVYFVPALVGLGAPHWDAYARGTLLGVTRGTTRAHIVRATLEAICYQTRDVVEAMRRDLGIPLKELRCDGGASVNSFLMQFQADILGVPVEVPGVPETTALGAAYLAGLATGYWQSREEIDGKWQMARRYTPEMTPETRDRLYAKWNRALGRAMDWAREDV